jgi:hypothetical protein
MRPENVRSEASAPCDWTKKVTETPVVDLRWCFALTGLICRAAGEPEGASRRPRSGSRPASTVVDLNDDAGGQGYASIVLKQAMRQGD